MFTAEKLAHIRLSLTEGIGSVLLKNLIAYCGSAEAVFTNSKPQLAKIPGISSITANRILDPSSIALTEQQVKLLEKNKASAISYRDPEYPSRLKQLYDCPSLLYYAGSANLNHTKIISIVGTRNATDYGREQAKQIVADFKDHNVLIVSGLAYGIDIAAHKACLEYGVETIAALAGGIDWIYPADHRRYASEIKHLGGLISEQPMGKQPARGGFPARNRIIAGMADCTIVVEASAKGGALITAGYANNYNRDVFAIPGNLGQGTSEGCNNLIKNHLAEIYTSAKDIVENQNWDIHLNPKLAKPELDLSSFSQDEAQILSLLKTHKEISIDELAWLSQLHMSTLASLLLTLEFQGLVKSMPGKKFALN
jgi:DNA processing protein